MCNTWGPLPSESKVNDSFCEKVNSMDQFLSENELLQTCYSNSSLMCNNHCFTPVIANGDTPIASSRQNGSKLGTGKEVCRD